MKILKSKILFFVLTALTTHVFGQVGTNGEDRKEEGRPVREYNLVLEQNKLTLGGVTADAMTINGSIPGPVLEFNEGDFALINVTNKMDVETSVHWHGLILPNFYDGVPYLTTPPIEPGTTFQYRIPINQSGTYWYHSHTMLQEQKGVYGSILIHPKEKTLDYDKDLVVVLSDWTNEKAMNVLRNLKRGNEWYQVKKGTAVPLSRVIKEGALGAQLKFWRDRMEGADIADIYYPAFLTNGKTLAEYPDFKPGEKVRLRFVNASASTYYWMDFGGGNPMVVSGDGVDVEPVSKSRFLFGIAETYDVIVTNKTDHSDMNQRMTATATFKNQLKQVLSAYLELKDALVNDNAAKSNAAAKKVLSALEHVDMKQLTDKKAHGHWMTISKEISNSANSISKISDIKAQRDHFKHLSAHLSKGVKLFGVDQKIYEQFCPMADNNKGAYWLSTTKEIKNPYFGEAMLTCGEITDEM